MAFDLILDHGTVLDGTGRDGFPASVAIADGRIAAVGVLDDASAARRLDCTGQVIAPGFIDMHSHSDWVISQPDHAEVLAPLLEQGITTIVAGNCGLSTGLGYAPGVFADLDELLGVTAPLQERGGVYTSHARSYIALDHRAAPDQPPTNLLALDETAAVWRAHGVKVQHSHLIFVGDRTWPTTDRALEHFDRLRDEGVDIGCDAFPYVGGNTTLVVFMPPWTLNQLRHVVTNPEQRQQVAGTLNWVLPSLGMRWEDTQILWVPKRELAHYEGRTIADIARERRQEPTETYLDLVGELGSQARIMNWNYSGRDAEEGSLRKVLQHGACCFETDTILTGNGVDNPASYGTFPRLLGRYVRELKLLTLPEAVRRMTGFNAERMNLRDRGRVERGLAADLVVFDPDTVNDDWQPGAPNRSPTGID